MSPFEKAVSSAVAARNKAELAAAAQKLNLSLMTMEALAELGSPNAPPNRNIYFLKALLRRHYQNFNPLRLSMLVEEAELTPQVILELAALLELSNPLLERIYRTTSEAQALESI